MKTIYKYPLWQTQRTSLTLPEGAKILSAQHQESANAICIWALVETENPIHTREFIIFGTGHVIPDELLPHLQYISTTQIDFYVFHIFEIIGGVQ